MVVQLQKKSSTLLATAKKISVATPLETTKQISLATQNKLSCNSTCSWKKYIALSQQTSYVLQKKKYGKNKNARLHIL
jgi:hypothetical protein